jgi:hypothetical protein
MLVQKLWQVARDQWDHMNDIFHRDENMVMPEESAAITTHVQEELAI